MNVTKLKIGVDIDSVLAEIMPLFLRSIEKRHGLILKKEDITKWNMKWNIFDLDDRMHEKTIDLYEEICFVLDKLYDDVIDVPLVAGAKEGMEYLRKHYDVKLITSRNETTTKIATQKWVKKNFGDIEVVFTDADKNGYNVDVLVDDAPHHITSFAQKGGWAIIFNQPWNKEIEIGENMHVLRAADWESVCSAVELVRILKLMDKNKVAG